MSLYDAVLVVSFVPFLVCIACHIWLVVLMMRNRTELGCLAILIPLTPWVFAAKNWDLSKRTVLVFAGAFSLWIATAVLSEYLHRAEMRAHRAIRTE